MRAGSWRSSRENDKYAEDPGDKRYHPLLTAEEADIAHAVIEQGKPVLQSQVAAAPVNIITDFVQQRDK